MSDWNDLTYDTSEHNDNELHVKDVGAWFDEGSGTIRWYAGDTFKINFKVDITKEGPCPNVYDDQEVSVADLFGTYLFRLDIYPIYGNTSVAALTVDSLEMNEQGLISVIIDDEKTLRLPAGIYYYSLVGYKLIDGILDKKTLVGRDKGKIQVLS